MKKYKFSFILPVYNVDSSLIEKCIKSIYNNFKNSKIKYEILIINDNSSSKKTLNYLNKIKNDKNIELINNLNNLGLGPSRNIGLLNSKGEYIWFIDPDDYIDNNSIYCINKFLLKEVDILSFNFFLIKSDIYKNNELFFKYNNLLIYGGSTVWSKIFKKDFLLKNNILFDNSKWIHEDEYFWHLCLLYKPKILTLKDCLYYYNKNNSLSITNISKEIDSYNALYNLFISLKKIIVKKNLLINKSFIKMYYEFIFKRSFFYAVKYKNINFSSLYKFQQLNYWFLKYDFKKKILLIFFKNYLLLFLIYFPIKIIFFCKKKNVK